MRLKLAVTDTPGFGEHVDNRGCWAAAVGHVKRQMEDYLSEELSVDRPASIPDRRVHACLYFIAPTGHGLKPLDVAFMRELHGLVNLVPVIAKADCLTVTERDAFKQRVRWCRWFFFHRENITVYGRFAKTLTRMG